MAGRRPFGKVRKLPSGRFQASFIGPNGRRQNAPNTFGTKTDADRWLARVRADISRGTWLDEQLGRRTLQEYAEAYLTDNPDVGQRWAETCRRNMRLHMVTLLDVPLVAITPPVVRSWYSSATRGTGGKTSIAQSYRFLRAVMNAAVRDDAITRNPCMIPGAGSVKSRERKIATPDQVAELITTISPERYRAAVVLAAWCALRRGEVCAMRREDVNLTKGTVWVRENHVELLESPVRYNKEPKTPAGKREISVPPHVLTFLVQHAERWAGSEWFFVGRDGKQMRGNAVYQAFVRARTKVGVDIAFHDLRHTGQSLAAAAGATLADLKKRLGHSSTAAANRYLHALDGRDAEVAKALSELARRANSAQSTPPRTKEG